MEKIITVENFSELIEQQGVTAIVDFWATWCGPCRMVAPEIEKLAIALEGKALVGKVNVDEQMALAEKFRIDAIPTILLFVDGQLKDKIVGVMTASEIKTKFGL